MFLGFDITHVPDDVQKLASKAAKWTKKIEDDLQSGIAIDIATLIPEGETMREQLLEICKIAVNSCNLIATLDLTGVKAILSRLGSDITKIQHDNSKHTISYYIGCFEIIFNDLFGKNK